MGIWRGYLNLCLLCEGLRFNITDIRLGGGVDGGLRKFHWGKYILQEEKGDMVGDIISYPYSILIDVIYSSQAHPTEKRVSNKKILLDLFHCKNVLLLCSFVSEIQNPPTKNSFDIFYPPQLIVPLDSYKLLSFHTHGWK